MARQKVVTLRTNTVVALHANPGTEYSGYYLGYKVVDSDYGPTKIHVLEGENGNLGVWGFPDLDSQLATVMQNTAKGQSTMVFMTEAGTGTASKKGFKPPKLAAVDADYELTRNTGSVSIAVETAEDADYEASSGGDEEDEGMEEPSKPLTRGNATPISAAQQANVRAVLGGKGSTSGITRKAQ